MTGVTPRVKLMLTERRMFKGSYQRNLVLTNDVPNHQRMEIETIISPTGQASHCMEITDSTNNVGCQIDLDCEAIKNLIHDLEQRLELAEEAAAKAEDDAWEAQETTMTTEGYSLGRWR